MSTPTKPTPTKPELFLTGRRTGGPTADDLLALFRKLTGREPSPEDVTYVHEEIAKLTAKPR
jgi:hypothetical protein